MAGGIKSRRAVKDRDGFGDFLVGTLDANHVFLVYGPPASGVSSLVDAGGRLTGVSTGDFVGDAVSSAGDMDGDGYDDLLVGARGVDTVAQNAGAVYLVFGSGM